MMKRILLLSIGLFLLTGSSGAQVIFNFDTPGSRDNFIIADAVSGGGTALDSLYQAADPTKRSPGMLVMHLNFTHNDKGACIRSGIIDPAGAQVITYWIYIPSGYNIPDSILISLFAQDNINGERVYSDTYAKDIPKGAWYPLSLFISQKNLIDPKFNIKQGKINQTGIIVSNSHAPAVQWAGYIYIDQAVLVGARPSLYADFKTGVSGFTSSWNNGWTTSVSQITGPMADSTGILKFSLSNGGNKTAGAAVGIEPSGGYNAASYNFLVFWIYADTTLPDSAYMQVWAQDNNLWNWPGPRGITTFYGKDIPKEVWFPVYFDLTQASIADISPGSSFNSQRYPLGKFGLQLDAPKNWSGSVYIDNVQFLNVYTPPAEPQWTAANFESASNGLQGFYVPGNSEGRLSRFYDSLSYSYVMKADIDLSKAPNSFMAVRDNVPLLDSQNPNLYATKVSAGIYVPSSIPSGSIIEFTINGDATGNKLIHTDYTSGSAEIVPGSWNTITMNTDSLVRSGAVNPAKSAQIGITLYYPGGSSNWAGSILLDNFIFYGITRPQQLVTGIEGDNADVKSYNLYNNYPNPFNPSTEIKYDIAKSSFVKIKVYNILGQQTATLVNERQHTGTYTVTFNGSDLPSGMYIYRITAGSFVQSHKMILLK